MDERKRRLIETAKEFNRKHKKNPLTDINLFSILRMENKEVSAHSSVLYYIFKPFYDKEQRDDLHLRLLLKNFGYEVSEDAYLDIQREVVTDFGRLDFLVEMDKALLIVELKIWAHEQHAQISRYQQYLQSRQAGGEVLFLTPKDRAATTGKQPVRNVTLDKEIKKTLEQIIEKRKNNVEYCTVLKQYITIIDKLSGEKEMDEMEILQSVEDILAVNRLIENKQQILTRLMRNFFETVKEELISLTENGSILSVEGCPQAFLADNDYSEAVKDYYEKDKNSHPAIIFEIPEYKLKNCEIDLTDYRLYFYVEIGMNLYAGFTLRRAEPKFGQLEKKELSLFRELIDKDVSSTFLQWDYVTLNGKINFRHLDGDESWIKKLFVENTFELDKNKMQQIVNHIKEIYRKQCQKILR